MKRKEVIAIYTLIIVDDEKNVLKNISNGIAWEELGFSLKGSFTSVKDALTFLESENVDCIISDIKMPGMDGLEFAKIIQERFPNTCFIILSAYQDFEYAQKALRYNVADYIVKPVTYGKIEQALTSATSKLKHRAPEFPRYFSSKHKLVSSIFEGKLSDISEIVKNFEQEGVSIDPDITPLALVKIQIENFGDFIENSWPYDISQFQNALSYIAQSDMPYIIETSFGYGYTTVLLIYENGTASDFLQFINKTITQIGNNYFDLLNCNAEFEIVSIYSNLKDFLNSKLGKAHTEIETEEILNAITSGNISDVHNILDAKFTYYKNNTHYIKLLAKCLITEVNNLININDIYEDFSAHELMNSNTDRIMELTRNIVDKATVFFLTKSSNSTNLITTVKDYIKEHYAENITLSDLANLVYISESHFSRTFKQKTGESVVAYINKVRLTHARELLIGSNLSIEDIYNSVGYKSRNLFFKNFKAVYGITPNKYRTENSNEI